MKIFCCSCIVFVLASCDGTPSRERFPGAEGRTTEVQQSQTEKAVLGGFDPLNNPIAGSAPFANANGNGSGPKSSPSKPGQSLHGVIDIGKNVKLREGMFLFIAARSPQGGPPLAVHREPRPDFPYEFTLSSADTMMGGAPFEGPVTLSVRLNQSGDPLSHEKGDYSGSVQTKVGDQKVHVTIDQEQ